MKNFLFSNSSTNYSSGGAYKSQSRGCYATPSLYTRNPVVDIKPISMAMPSFRGGDYRLLCLKEDDVLIITVVKVKHRKEVYEAE